MKTLEELTKIEYEKSKLAVAKRHTNYARRNHRYISRTGRLRRSTDTVRTRPYMKMVARMPYSRFIIGGHHNNAWAPDDFLNEAISALKEETKKEFKLSVKRAIRAYNRQGKSGISGSF